VIHPPGDVALPSREWSAFVQSLIQDALHGNPESDLVGALAGAEPTGQSPPFYDPVREPLEAREVPVTWPALSGTLRALRHLSAEERWEIADHARTTPATRPSGETLTDPEGRPLFGQDEYCEWSVQRNDAGDIVRVTFTSEVGEWFRHLAAVDPDNLVSLYRELAGEDVPRSAVLFEDGQYLGWAADVNTRTDGPIVHLAQGNNNLWAAVSLAAEASILRTRDGSIVRDSKVLMRCSGLGTPDRFSDPSIASTVNSAAANGSRISLANPPGLYLAGIRTEGLRLPAGHEDLDPQDLWVPERGEHGRTVRARFEAPDNAFSLSEVLLDDRPIRTGAQLAERVDVSLVALVHDARTTPLTKPCA
jgi:hypothetical protein